jgi:predicted component of type VI protein secretion system
MGSGPGRQEPRAHLFEPSEMERAMKTTVEVSDDLYRRAKAEAALRGRKLKDLVEEGLRLVLETPRESGRRRSLAALMKGARGAVDSGIPDLASNPEYLTGFGHDARVCEPAAE